MSKKQASETPREKHQGVNRTFLIDRSVSQALDAFCAERHAKYSGVVDDFIREGLHHALTTEKQKPVERTPKITRHADPVRKQLTREYEGLHHEEDDA